MVAAQQECDRARGAERAALTAADRLTASAQERERVLQVWCEKHAFTSMHMTVISAAAFGRVIHYIPSGAGGRWSS